ncbi:hypothetical protein HMPREF0580_1971 [Mobiluncus mulieris ATCC 35239]|uniref:Uncharacterized protein n=1 Tax=Mobiluncus mulieris ATCC 35239 TaxID=871571 RepID=E0QSU3_9ACTO|nr:hypothetical protein HMPREF0580_1971 [Mobiluncus mulieris ATCC 35239]
MIGFYGAQNCEILLVLVVVGHKRGAAPNESAENRSVGVNSGCSNLFHVPK